MPVVCYHASQVYTSVTCLILDHFPIASTPQEGQLIFCCIRISTESLYLDRASHCWPLSLGALCYY